MQIVVMRLLTKSKIILKNACILQIVCYYEHIEAANTPERSKAMTRMIEMHIEYLTEMMESDNKEWAEAAAKEMKEIKDLLAEKGVVIV